MIGQYYYTSFVKTKTIAVQSGSTTTTASSTQPVVRVVQVTGVANSAAGKTIQPVINTAGAAKPTALTVST